MLEDIALLVGALGQPRRWISTKPTVLANAATWDAQPFEYTAVCGPTALAVFHLGGAEISFEIGFKPTENMRVGDVLVLANATPYALRATGAVDLLIVAFDEAHVRQSPVPIAGGEVLTRRQSFMPWLVRGAFDIVQPDATKVGGISEQRRIAWMAEEFGVRYIGHGWNTAIGVAADLQISAAMPHVDVVEFIGGSAYVDGLLAEPFKLDSEGYLEIPMKPGIGVALDPDEVARYSPKAARLFKS